MFRRTVVFLFFFLPLSVIFSIVSDDIIILKNGSEYHGSIIEITKELVTIKTNSELLEYKTDEVSMVQFGNQRKYSMLSSVDELDDEIKAGFSYLTNYKALNDENVIYYYDKVDIEYNEETITKTIRVMFKVLTDNGKNSTSASFTFKNDAKAKLDYAITITNDGKLHSIRENAINKEPFSNTYPRYNLYSRIKFSMQYPQKENIFIYQYTIVEKYNPLIDFVFEKLFLRDDEPYLSKELTIKGYNGRLSSTLLYGESDFNKPVIINKPGYFNVLAKQITAMSIEEDFIPSKEYVIPHVLIVDRQKNDVAEIIENNLRNQDPKEAELAVIAFLKQNNFPDSVKNFETNDVLARLYTLLKNTTSVPPFPPSYTNFVPDELTEIMKDIQRSQLDSAYLFYVIAQHFSVKPEMFFATRKSLPAKYKYINSPYLYDSVGVKYTLDKKTYYLVFDKSLRSYGSIPDFLSKNKIHILKNGKITQHLVAKLDINSNSENHDYHISFEDSTMNFTKKSIFFGDSSSSIRQLRNESSKNLINILETDISSIKIGTLLQDYVLSDSLEDINKPASLIIQGSAKNYLIKSEDISLLYFPEFSYDASFVSLPSRKYSGNISTVQTIRRKYCIEIPENYSFKSIPPSSHLKFEKSSFSVGYSISGQTLNCTITSTIDNPIFTRNTYENFKNFIEKRAELSTIPLVLERNK